MVIMVQIETFLLSHCGEKLKYQEKTHQFNIVRTCHLARQDSYRDEELTTQLASRSTSQMHFFSVKFLYHLRYSFQT